MNAHSAILGGSNADRILNCPASFHEARKNPLPDVSSVYADEGTLLHSEMAARMTRKGPVEGLLTEEQLQVLDKARDALDALEDLYGGGFRTIAVEQSLPMPGVTGSFGSVDIIRANASTVIIGDWKFGGGIKVHAVYREPEGDRINPQLPFYACAARAKYRRRFKDKRIILAIVQPRMEPALDYVETTDQELDEFQVAFHAAYIEALGKDAHRERGDWCRFAPCKTTCPLWNGAVLDLALIDPAKAALRASQASPAEGRDYYGAFLSKALDLAALAEFWVDEVRRQSHVFLEDGGAVPGWKLVPKRGTRKWLNEDTAQIKLLNLGAEKGDMWTEPELRSVAQVEKNLKKRRIDLPADLWQSVSSGTTIARADDGRPDLDEGRVIEDLRTALKAL